jgi:peptidoglycan/LPS O-acetylase OafA/YrhL
VAFAGGIALLGWFFAGRGLRPDAFLAQTAGYSVLGATAAAILVLGTTAAVGSRLRIVLTHPALRFFGRYSYGIYLIHGPLYLMWRNEPWYAQPRVLWGSQLPGAFTALLTVAVVATGLAMLSWHLYEKQFLKLKAHFPYDRTGAGQPGRAGPNGLLISDEGGSPH